MKKIFALIFASIMIFSFASCKSINEQPNLSNYKIALVCNFNDTQEDSLGVDIFHSIEKFYDSSKNLGRKYHPQSNKNLHIISTVASAINDGYNVISVIGNEYGNAISSIAAEYPHITFVIFGMTDAIALHNNIYCCYLNSDYLAFYKSILK